MQKQEKFYNIWRRMKTKCKKQNEKDKNANILICESWLTYDNFKKWCEKECKDETMFFVRKDFTKDFCPDNCTFMSETDAKKFNAKKK